MWVLNRRIGNWKLTCADVHTQKILHSSIHSLWLISFVWTSKNLKWNNITCCSKMKAVWKLIFPGHFVPLLAPFNETRINVSKAHDVRSTGRFSGRRKRIVIKQITSMSGYTKIPYGLYCPSVWKCINKQSCKDTLSKLGCCQITQERQ